MAHTDQAVTNADGIALRYGAFYGDPADPLAGEVVVVFSTESRGASNAKAKAELGWRPCYPSWRQGFVAAYGQPKGSTP